MTSDEFESLSPIEIQWRLEAETERENREYERLAQTACWIVNPWLKRKLKVKDLIKRRG